MIYAQKYLRVKLVVENVCKYELLGFYRPQAYIKGDINYCTECQLELIRKGIEPGESSVVSAVLLAPYGFGDLLKQGTLLTLQNGLDVEATAIVLEISGYSK
jgi:hypothetical protein